MEPKISVQSSTSLVRPSPKRFARNQIPETLLNDPSLNAAISLLPKNYAFEIHKCLWRVISTSAKRVALQLPEGLLMYSLVLSDIFTQFGHVTHCFILGDVTYGACCVDDFSAKALSVDLLIHYGHSCLIPVDLTCVPCMYVFVEIAIDLDRLIDTVKLNLGVPETFKSLPKAIKSEMGVEENCIRDVETGLPQKCIRNLVLAGTIQFASAIRAAKLELEKEGFNVLVPQSRPLSSGEILGCTAPAVQKCMSDEAVLVFIADGRFHLEAFMIANPEIKAFRYDPYVGSLFSEEYDHKGMMESRRNAIMKAREGARNWGIVLGSLGRQGNPTILDRLERKMSEKGFSSTVIMMSEITPARVALFEDSLDAWIQIACPRLSIDWGDAFGKPLLNPFEAEIALGFIPGWWEKDTPHKSNCNSKGNSCCNVNDDNKDLTPEYPMDYYAQDGAEWNSTYVKRPPPRNKCIQIG